jgi:molecular chaperone GrpE
MAPEDTPIEGEVLDSVDPEAAADSPEAPAESADSNANAEESLADSDAAMAAEIVALKARLARARADYDNLQKRQQRDAALERDRVKGRVLEDFLQVYEYGKMAEFEAERNPGPLAQGIKMVIREFDRLLENNGVLPIGTLGEPFDGSHHDAVDTLAADGVEPGHVSKVVQTGYRLGDRVLRAAKVAVAPTE